MLFYKIKYNVEKSESAVHADDENERSNSPKPRVLFSSLTKPTLYLMTVKVPLVTKLSMP